MEEIKKMGKKEAYEKARWIIRNYLTNLHYMTGENHYLASAADVSKENITEHLKYYIKMLTELKDILEGDSNE